MKRMNKVSKKEYNNFVKDHVNVIIEDTKLDIGRNWKIEEFQPKKFDLEATTVWSFPNRGKWATHYLNSRYRGNWAPQVPRNLILRYSKEGDTVLDAFVGSGTTLIECKLLFRSGIGVDINRDAVMLCLDRLNFSYNVLTDKPKISINVFTGDARNLDKLSDESIDLIVAHPPYANIISYTKKSNKRLDGDLSHIRSINVFIEMMNQVAAEFYRVLKPGKYCAILIGDTRRHKHQVPISFRVMKTFLESGFVLKENVIKLQHNMKTTGFWRKKSIKYNFLLLAHEHLFIFRKPKKSEDLSKLKESSKW